MTADALHTPCPPAADGDTRQHGTNVCYVFGPRPGGDPKNGCRGRDCQVARARYEQQRKARTEPPYIGASPAREHVHALATQGVGLKTIAKASGVSHGTLTKLMYGVTDGPGRKARPPSKRIRPETAAAILAVTPADGADGSRVPAGPTLANIERLVAAGIPKVRIAERIGQTRALQIGTTCVTRQNAKAIADMVAELDAATVEDETPPPPPLDDFDTLLIDMAELLEERIDQNGWRKDAACRGRAPWMFFPSRGDYETLAAARKICGACFVREQCLDTNLDKREGVYAGTTYKQRVRIRARRAEVAA